MTSKDTNSKPTGLLRSLPIPKRPWQSIGLDFMGPLPKSNNFNYLLVVIDRLTSQVHLVPTTMTVTARGVMWLILKEFKSFLLGSQDLKPLWIATRYT